MTNHEGLTITATIAAASEPARLALRAWSADPEALAGLQDRLAQAIATEFTTLALEMGARLPGIRFRVDVCGKSRT